jgi:hypothetical protein
MSAKLNRKDFVLVEGKRIYPPEPISIKHFSNPFKFEIDELNFLIAYEISRYSWCNGFYDWELWTVTTIEALKDVQKAFKQALETKNLKQGIEIASSALYIYSAVVYTESLRVYQEDSLWIRDKYKVLDEVNILPSELEYLFTRYQQWGLGSAKDNWLFVRPNNSLVTLPPPSKRKRRNTKEDVSAITERLVATAEQNRVDNRQRKVYRYHYFYTLHVR